MTIRLNNIQWHGNKTKLVGFCDEGIILAEIQRCEAIYMNNNDRYYGYIYVRNNAVEFTTDRGE